MLTAGITNTAHTSRESSQSGSGFYNPDLLYVQGTILTATATSKDTCWWADEHSSAVAVSHKVSCTFLNSKIHHTNHTNQPTYT